MGRILKLPFSTCFEDGHLIGDSLGFEIHYLDPKQVENPLRTLAFKFWQESWEQTFLELDSKETLFSDPFWGAEVVVCILLDRKPIGLCILNSNSLDDLAIKGLKRFQFYDPQVWVSLRERSIHKLMTIEWLVVKEIWRASHGGAVAKLLMYFSYMWQRINGYCIAIGMTRNNRSVNKLLKYFGAKQLAPNAIAHNVEVSFLGLSLKEFDDNKIEEIINEIGNIKIAS